MYTIHDPKTGERFPADRTPLSRAMRGIPSDHLELLVKSEGREDRLIRVTGRPLRDESHELRGGIITFNDITALRAVEDELARRAVTDPLTGLSNRRALDERLELLVAEGGRGRQFALVIADVDHFKRVNDTHGHTLGDQVLAHVALVLQSSIRCTDLVARFGGEEFCVLFTDVDATLAQRLAENLRRAVAEQACSVPVTISLGVCANRPKERTTAKALLEAADRALYSAKRQGRNCVVSAQLSVRESIPLVASSAKARA
jgi:diguanylate cyclase (GGDEF)-like protein